ncbi:MAG: helix-turn-helix transcriptional regulator [Clostridia bacterium]|nr:helix-turn-helix transcriptional regulator [Clostridia bacterium]
MYLLYKKINIHPFRLISVCIGIGCVGFLFMFAATQISVLSYFACVFIGVGMLPCQMLPLYGVVLMKSYPSRFFSPVTILLALMAVLVQSSVVEVFRTMQSMVYLVYALIMVILAIIYIQIEPFLLYNFKRKMQDDEVPEIKADTREEKNTLLDCLSKRELEVVDLIAAGYRNADIAKMLFISVHTVNDHTKNIYRKLDVHSRFELTALVNKNNA